MDTEFSDMEVKLPWENIHHTSRKPLLFLITDTMYKNFLKR